MSKENLGNHFGEVRDLEDFSVVRQRLIDSGPCDFTTANGIPFTAEAHLVQGGVHNAACIKITNNGQSRAYIYPCCWGHQTNCYGTHIDIYAAQI